MKPVAVCPALTLKNCSPYSIVLRTTVLCKVFASSTVHTNEKELSSSGSDWPCWMAPSKPHACHACTLDGHSASAWF